MADAKSIARCLSCLGEPSTLRSHRTQWEHPQPCAASWRRLPLGLAGLSVAAVADDAKLRSYGRHLAQECTGCHRIDGVDNGIPSIVAWDRERFVDDPQFYQAGDRTNPVMVSVAKSLDDGPARGAGRLLRLAAEAGTEGEEIMPPRIF